MNLKLMLGIVSCMLVPTFVGAQDNNVVQTTELAPKYVVGSKISTTASPTANRKVQEVRDVTARFNASVVVPEANAFEERLQVAIAPGLLREEHLHVVYPIVNSVSPAITRMINEKLLNYVKGLEDRVRNYNNKGHEDKRNLYVTYDVKADGKGILSVLVKSYEITDQAANGLNTVKGFTFNTATGKLLTLSDFGGVNRSKLERFIATAPPDVKEAMFSDVKVEEPEEFYVTENQDVYLVLQQGVAGPMSSGTIYLPAGSLGR